MTSLSTTKGVAAVTKNLAIAFNTELDPDLYADIANTLWKQINAMSDRGKR
ncbi:hypothetical protein HGA13_25760 [Nocardia speluncae]|uniref:Uncharacterized protein n=1 Tax=Nocardia speluncae TaxID=419477 RepID=A0A846XJP1_9NOCA|nr:hypothetical protein [Nocardia speluncae]NKY36448.1 hypothetical protein [Nocardia speluncae]